MQRTPVTQPHQGELLQGIIVELLLSSYFHPPMFYGHVYSVQNPGCPSALKDPAGRIINSIKVRRKMCQCSTLSANSVYLLAGYVTTLFSVSAHFPPSLLPLLSSFLPIPSSTCQCHSLVTDDKSSSVCY